MKCLQVGNVMTAILKNGMPAGNSRRGKYATTGSLIDLMRANNPVVIPRNHKVEQALKRHQIYNL